MADRLLWSSYPLVAHRCHPLLPPVQASACESSASNYKSATDRQGKFVSNAQIWKCTKVVLLTHFTCEAPLILAFHPICAYFGMATFNVPFTPWPIMAAQIACFFVFEGKLTVPLPRRGVADDRFLPLRRSPSSTLGTSLQEHPQASPRVLCSYRSSCRIRPPTRSPYPRPGYHFWPLPLLSFPKGSPYPHRLPLGHSTTMSSS